MLALHKVMLLHFDEYKPNCDLDSTGFRDN